MAKQPNNALIRQLWLTYFNRILFQQGLISDSAYRQMALRICAAYKSSGAL